MATETQLQTVTVTPAPAAVSTPDDIVSLARARLMAIETQLLAYERLRTEADKLRRMLAAVSE
jgi:hypothetical protein